MLILLLALFVSAVVTAFAVRATGRRGRWLLDHDVSGPQKFHIHPVPRVGGLGIVVGLAAAFTFMLKVDSHAAEIALLLLACGAPAFAAGITEDMTKSVSPRVRLLATAVSAGLAVALLDAAVRRTDIPGLDWVVSFAFGSALVTVFAVAGIANAVNIIDGFNGLASMCATIMLGALAYVAFEAGDRQIAMMALAGVGAVLGFFFWNYPAGLIFLGDGGAYFLGFYVAELSILLLARNPGVSPLFPLLVVVYPVVETIFSIYRRRVLRAMSPSMPDGIHLHSLIYRRMLRWAVGDRSAKALTRRNSMTSPYLWLLCMMSVVPAMVFWDSTPALAILLALFVAGYVGLYWRIVRFRAPRWMYLPAWRIKQVPRGDNRGT